MQTFTKKGFVPVLVLIIIAGIGLAVYLGLPYFKNNPPPAQEINSSLSGNDVTGNPSPTSSVVESALNSQILADLVAGGLNCKTADDAGNVKDVCKVDKVVGNFAKGQMPMAYWLAMKISTKWKVVITGNGIPQCAEIDNYSIPKEIYGNCIEASGELRF